jgi:crossover junction endodeoxyribonuclease RusA
VTRSWLLVIPMRPTLTNAVHNMHFRKASAERKKWRGMGLALAEQAKVPACTAIEVTCWGVYPGGRLPDPDAVAPSLKGVLDGLVDAGVVPDDTGEWVKAITYLPAVKEKGVDAALHVLIEDVG